jgi:hypothetical protein
MHNMVGQIEITSTNNVEIEEPILQARPQNIGMRLKIFVQCEYMFYVQLVFSSNNFYFLK